MHMHRVQISLVFSVLFVCPVVSLFPSMSIREHPWPLFPAQIPAPSVICVHLR